MSTFIETTSATANPTMEPLLRELLSIQTESGNCAGIRDWLVALGYRHGWNPLEDKIGNIYLTKGVASTYPCVVAHMDTVHRIEKGNLVPVEIDGYVTGINSLSMKQSGIGGDDKCGVWAGVRCLLDLDYCKAVFFVDEERGCRGSGKCDLPYFSDCRFILQADRRGHADFVNEIGWSDLSSADFQTAVGPLLVEYGYKLSAGMMTDVEQLRDDKVGISVANMSAGYYNPHCDSEFISLWGLDNCIALMQAICTTLTDVYPFVPPDRPRAAMSPVSNGSNWNNHNGDGCSRDIDDPWEGVNGKKESFPDYKPRNESSYICHGCGEFSDGLVGLYLGGESFCADCAIEMEGYFITAADNRRTEANLGTELASLSEVELEARLRSVGLTHRQKRAARKLWRNLKNRAAKS